MLVASPVISLGGTRPLLLGLAIAALTVCFLWLERLPLRPGLGVAALLGLALAGALPLAAMADRGEPWFDYKAFAEGLGPDDPVRFDWSQSYGPIDWPRDGNEVMRVSSDEPHYWKVASLEHFDGAGWADAERADRRRRRGDEMRDDWRDRPGWLDEIEVSVRRMRTRDVPAPGTIIEVQSSTRPLAPAGEPGRWGRPPSCGGATPTRPRSTRRRRRRASCVRPTPRASSRRGPMTSRSPCRSCPAGGRPRARSAASGEERVESAVVHFRPVRLRRRAATSRSRSLRRTLYGFAAQTLRRSAYRRTWQLSQRLRSAAETPFEYILPSTRTWTSGFGYSERPSRRRRGARRSTPS